MTEKESSLSHLQIIYFSGKESEWDDWAFTFKARARLFGYINILTGAEKAPTKSELDTLEKDASKSQDDKDIQKKLFKANNEAWSHLVCSMKVGTTAMSILKAYEVDDVGDAYNGFKALSEHYTIRSVATIQKLLGDFYDKKLAKGQNPSVFITEMENIRIKIATVDKTQAITDKSFILRILNKLTPDYGTTVQILEMKLDQDPTKVTIASVRDSLMLDFQRQQNLSGRTSTSTTSSDTVLYAGGFKGKCSKCGKYGHRRSACRSTGGSNGHSTTPGSDRKPPPSGGSSIVCGYCKKPGHTKEQCYKLQNKRGGNGHGNNAGSGGDKAEVVLTVVETYTRLCKCDRCDDTSSFGFANRKCKVCFVGTYKEDLPPDHSIGRCDKCHGISTVGTICEPCTDEDIEDGDVDVHEFDPFDTDSVHLDLITSPTTMSMFVMSDAHVDTLLDPHADATAVAEAIVSVAPGMLIPNPRPLRIPQFFPSPIDTLMDTSDAEYFPLLLHLIAENNNHRYNLRLFLEQVGIWLYKTANGIMTPLIQSNVYTFVRLYVYSLVNMGILTVSHLVHHLHDVNQLLQREGFTTFSDEHLKWICRLGPVWLKAEYRFELRNELPLPHNLLNRLPESIRREYTFEQTLFEAERRNHDGHTVGSVESQDSFEADPQETAFVEYSYFIASRSTNDNMWIGDSGASCHMTCSLDGMHNLRTISSPIQIGTGDTIECTQIGDKLVKVIQQDGSTRNIELKNCKYVPGLFTNLFSITKALEQDWRISNEGVNITLSKSTASLTFDHVLRTDSGAITAIEMVPRHEEVNVTLERGKHINVNKLHLLLGHVCENTLRQTANHYGMILEGQLKPCPECALAKVRQANVAKVTNVVSTKPGERLYIDVSSVKAKSFGGAKFWLLIVDHYTDYCWSAFLKTKSEVGERVRKFIKMLKLQLKAEKDWTVIRCDNAGENLVMPDIMLEGNLRVRFEFTPPGSPQYNGVVERKFKTLYARVRTLLNSAQLSQELREGVWAECAKYSTDIENMIVKPNKTVSSWEMFYGRQPPMFSVIRQFGEVAIVEEWQKRGMRGKLDDRGRPCIYVGRAPDHAESVLRFLNLETQRIVVSRDITWLNKTYATFKNLDASQLIDHDSTEVIELPLATVVPAVPIVNPPPIPPVDHNNNALQVLPITPVLTTGNSEVPLVVSPTTNEDTDTNAITADDIVETNEDETTEEVVNPRVIRELNRLGTTLANVPITEHRSLRSGRDDEDGVASSIPPDMGQVHVGYVFSDFSLLTHEWFGSPALLNVDPKTLNPASYKDHFYIPKNFDEAWYHDCPFQRKLWRDAITKEFDKMKQYQVYKVVKRTTIPKGRKCVKHKWVFDIKRNGVFRARLVACGYSQQPGVDFTESYSPVINDAVFRLLIIMEILFKLVGMIIDVETAFLNGDLEEEIYMDAPQGSNLQFDDVWLLVKSLYGLVQSARQFFLKFREILLKLQFKQSEIEPCLFSKQSNDGVIFVVVYVDDCYVVGHEHMLRMFIEDLKAAGLKLKIEEKPSDYLSCEVKFNTDKSKAWLGQPHLLKKLEKSFGHYIKGSYKYLTPGTPGYTITRPNNESDRLSSDKQTIFRSGVGTLLQFVKHSRPDIANAVRELSKCMDSATEGAFKEMIRVISFVLATKDHGLYFNPKPLVKQDDAWDMIMYSDSDWAGDLENRRSITGFILFVMGCPVVWKSKQQGNVTLSSTEAEYVACSESIKEIMFVAHTLESVGIKVNYPITVKVDNVGAIFMSENVTATARSRHIDARFHFIREYIENNEVKIVFVRTKENKADVFTKNTKSEDFKSVMDYMMDKTQFETREGVKSPSGT